MNDLMAFAQFFLFVASGLYFFVLTLDHVPRISSALAGSMFVSAAGLCFVPQSREVFLTALLATVAVVLIRRAVVILKAGKHI